MWENKSIRLAKAITISILELKPRLVKDECYIIKEGMQCFEHLGLIG